MADIFADPECLDGGQHDARRENDMSLRLWPAEDITCDPQAVSTAERRTLRHPGDDLADASVVPVTTRSVAARPVPTRQVVYDADRRPASRRSVMKRAIIIGSSAGVGAGVGAAIGGKKGALVGLAIGGGSAAVWDQVTRR